MSEHRIGTREEWGFPWVSTSGSDFPFDFGLALTEEQMADTDEVRQMIERVARPDTEGTRRRVPGLPPRRVHERHGVESRSHAELRYRKHAQPGIHQRPRR